MKFKFTLADESWGEEEQGRGHASPRPSVLVFDNQLPHCS